MREFKVGDKIRVNLHHGQIEDAVVRAVIQDDDGSVRTLRPTTSLSLLETYSHYRVASDSQIRN